MMPTRIIFAAAVLTLSAAACGPRRATTVPVPVPGAVPERAVVERAPVPAANPALPPVPDVRGPLQIKVVYPVAGQMIASRDSNFILGSVGSGDAGLRINGVLVPVWPNGSFMGWIPNPSPAAPQYDLVATNGLDTARLSLPVQVRTPAVMDTTARDTVALLPAPPRPAITPAPAGQYALLSPAGPVVNDTDRAVIGMPIPVESGQQYKWFFLPGTVAPVVGYKGHFAQLRLDSTTLAWVDTTNMRLQPANYAPAPLVAGAGITVQPSTEWVDVVVPMSSAPPYLVEESDRSISLLLYGTRAATALSALPMQADSYVSGVTAAADSSGLRLSVNLSRAPYGYLVLWQDGALTLRVRRPPVIADPSAPLRGLTITVDPGHPPGGATGPTSLHESEAVLAVGLKLRDMLIAKGANVVMTRTTMDPVELGLRPIISRRANANAFVSIHLDAEPDGANPFTHPATAAYYFWPHSVMLSQLTISRLAPLLGTPLLGSKFGNFAVIRGTWMPSILCEGGLLIMPDVEAAFRTPQYQEAYARGILAGLESYFASLARSQ